MNSIIDFHCHVFYSTDSKKILETQFEAFKGYGFFERIRSAVETIKSIQTEDPSEKTEFHAHKAGIEKVVLLPLSIKENEIVKSWANSNPELFIPFYNPPEKEIDGKNPIDMTDDALSDGMFKGLKIMLPFRKKKLNDQLILPILEKANEHDIPVLMHSGYPPPGTKKSVLTYSSPLAVDELAASFPNLKLIIAHMGFPWVDLAMALAVQYKNVYLDISNLTYMMPSRLEVFLFQAREMIGLKKILFGSDAFIPEMLESIVQNFKRNTDLNKKERELILRENARKILFK
ncbi:MAG: amidohydrolase family protein [Candidatus Helarchaeales archaeon]